MASLLYAAEGGSLLDVRRIVLSNPLILNYENEKGQTALFIACAAGRLEVVQFLLKQQGIKLDVVDTNGNNLSHAAARGGNADVFKLVADDRFLNNTNKQKQTALFIACATGRLNIVSYLLAQKSINLDVVDTDGNNLLHAAAQGGNAAVVHLVERRMKRQALRLVDKQNRQGETVRDILARKHIELPSKVHDCCLKY